MAKEQRPPRVRCPPVARFRTYWIQWTIDLEAETQFIQMRHYHAAFILYKAMGSNGERAATAEGSEAAGSGA